MIYSSPRSPVDVYVISVLQGAECGMSYWLLDFACHFVFNTQHHIPETHSFPSLGEILRRCLLSHISSKSVFWIELVVWFGDVNFDILFVLIAGFHGYSHSFCCAFSVIC
jgi:hypothetical protein